MKRWLLYIIGVSWRVYSRQNNCRGMDLGEGEKGIMFYLTYYFLFVLNRTNKSHLVEEVWSIILLTMVNISIKPCYSQLLFCYNLKFEKFYAQKIVFENQFIPL